MSHIMSHIRWQHDELGDTSLLHLDGPGASPLREPGAEATGAAGESEDDDEDDDQDEEEEEEEEEEVGIRVVGVHPTLGPLIRLPTGQVCPTPSRDLAEIAWRSLRASPPTPLSTHLTLLCLSISNR